MSQLLSEFWLQIFISFAIIAIASLALYLCFIGGQFSLGHGALVAAGAYSAGLVSTKTGLPFGASLAIAVVVGAVVGGLMGILSLRIQEFYLAIGTLAFGAAAVVVIINSESLGGATGLVGVSLSTTADNALIALIVVTAVVVALRHSRFGRGLMALREDARLAASVGVRVWALKLACFAISGAIAGLGGALFAHNLAIVRPEDFGMSLSLSLWVTVIVGGTATVAGPIVGSFIVVLLTEWLRTKIEIDALYIEGALLILVMLVRPNGLIGAGDLGSLRRLVRLDRSPPTASTAKPSSTSPEPEPDNEKVNAASVPAEQPSLTTTPSAPHSPAGGVNR